MKPEERISKGIGVVGVVCAACRTTVIVVDAEKFKRDLQTGAAYYVCKACDERPDIEELLVAEGNGLELLVRE